MGLAFSRVWERMFGKTEQRILMVGLDAAGKTTILYKLKLGEVVTTIPTIGTWRVREFGFFIGTVAPPVGNVQLTIAPHVRPLQRPCSYLHRLQRRECRVQEHLLHGVGCWWTGQGEGWDGQFFFSPPGFFSVCPGLALQPAEAVPACPRGQIRPLWRHYYQNTNGIIFVVDSNDRERIDDGTLPQAVSCQFPLPPTPLAPCRCLLDPPLLWTAMTTMFSSCALLVRVCVFVLLNSPPGAGAHVERGRAA